MNFSQYKSSTPKDAKGQKIKWLLKNTSMKEFKKCALEGKNYLATVFHKWELVGNITKNMGLLNH